MGASTGHDERWDELAVGHVLGGLQAADASAFRTHLTRCPQCRARVAELRSLDSALAAAEREERAVQRVRAATDDDDEDLRAAPPPTQRTSNGAALIVLLFAVAVMAILSIWNAQLRTQNTEFERATTLQEQTLRVLGSGEVVPLEVSGSVTGVVAVEEDRIAYTLAGLPVPDVGERLVVWVEVDGEHRALAAHTPSQVATGELASTVVAAGATMLLLTIEPAVLPEEPTGTVVVRAQLDRTNG